MTQKEHVNRICKSFKDDLSKTQSKETDVRNAKLDRDRLEEDCSPSSPKCTVFKAEYFILRMMKGRSIRLDWYTQEVNHEIGI